MLLEEFRDAASHAQAFKNGHAVPEAPVGKRQALAWLEGRGRPTPGFHEIVSSRVMPKRSMRLRSVARVMPRSFAARTWFPFMAFIA